jgi:hypothetical protein
MTHRSGVVGEEETMSAVERRASPRLPRSSPAAPRRGSHEDRVLRGAVDGLIPVAVVGEDRVRCPACYDDMPVTAIFCPNCASLSHEGAR